MVECFPGLFATEFLFPYPPVSVPVPIPSALHQLMIAQHPMNFKPTKNRGSHPLPSVPRRACVDVPQMHHEVQIRPPHLRGNFFGNPEFSLGISHNSKSPWWIQNKKKKRQPHEDLHRRLFYGLSSLLVQPHVSVVPLERPETNFRLYPHIHM